MCAPIGARGTLRPYCRIQALLAIAALDVRLGLVDVGPTIVKPCAADDAQDAVRFDKTEVWSSPESEPLEKWTYFQAQQEETRNEK